LSPRSEFWPLGVKLSPGDEIICSPLHSSKHYRVFTPRGQSSSLGAKFIPRCKLHPWGWTLLLKTGLSLFHLQWIVFCCNFRRIFISWKCIISSRPECFFVNCASEWDGAIYLW
jgi:hypothetical protein